MPHTPGPWTWWTSNSWLRLKHDNRGKSLNVLEPVICADGHPDCIVSDADMALIAAAPELLSVLKDTLASLEYWYDCARGEPPGSVTPESTAGRARAAIAKAEGK